MGVCYRELRNMRRDLNYTLEEASEKSGVSLPYISRIETGKAQPSIAVLDRLCRAYDLTLSLIAYPEESYEPPYTLY